MGLLDGKRVLITGVASKRSIAWGIAKSMHREGAELAFTYLGDKLGERVTKYAAEVDSTLVIPCDASNDDSIAEMYATLGKHWDGLDTLVHSIAYAPGEMLKGDFLEDLTREGFATAHDISAYSFPALAKGARPMMQGRHGASMITMTYLGAVQTMPNYNLMGVAKAALESCTRYMSTSLGPEGIRVNAISAGPIKTPAAAGIADFRNLLDFTKNASAIRSNVTIEQVGDTATFMASHWATGISGQVIYVDGGFNIVAMPSPYDEDNSTPPPAES